MWRWGQIHPPAHWSWTKSFLWWFAMKARRSSWRLRAKLGRNQWLLECVARSWDRDFRPAARSVPDFRRRRCSWCSDRAGCGSGVRGCWGRTCGRSCRCRLKKIVRISCNQISIVIFLLMLKLENIFFLHMLLQELIIYVKNILEFFRLLSRKLQFFFKSQPAFY